MRDEENLAPMKLWLCVAADPSRNRRSTCSGFRVYWLYTYIYTYLYIYTCVFINIYICIDVSRLVIFKRGSNRAGREVLPSVFDKLKYWLCSTNLSTLERQQVRLTKFCMERELNQNLSGNEIYYTNLLLSLVKNMPCVKLYCQKAFSFNSLFI